MVFDFGSRGRSSSRRQESGGNFNFMDAARTGSDSVRPSYNSTHAAADYSRSGSQSGRYGSRSSSLDRSIYGHGLNARDLSPMRESTRPRRGPMVWEDRPVSPLGSSHFERPSQYADRQARSSSSRASSNPYVSSSYERPSVSSSRSYQIDRGYDGAFAINRGFDGMTNGFPEGPGLSRSNAVRRPAGRSYSHVGYEARPRVASNFRFGGFGDWERF